MLSALVFAQNCLECDIKLVLPQASNCGSGCQWFQMSKDSALYKKLHDEFGANVRHYQWQTSLSSNVSHCKFALFSQLNSKYHWASNVVAQSSGNWNADDPRRVNDLFVKAGSHALFTAFGKWWLMLWALAGNKAAIPPELPVFTPSTYRLMDSSVQGYFFCNKSVPGFASDADPRVALLKSVHAPTCRIRIAMSTWHVYTVTGKNNVPMRIEKLLGTLKQQGADIAVAVHDDETLSSVRDNLNNAKIPYVITHSHNKYMTVEGDFLVNEGGVLKFRRRHIVVTGSYNFQPPSMMDTLIQINDDSKIYYDYLDAWGALCSSKYSSQKYGYPCGGGEGCDLDCPNGYKLDSMGHALCACKP